MKAEKLRNAVKTVLMASDILPPNYVFKQIDEELEQLESKATAYDSKEVQNAIECDRIERKLFEKGYTILYDYKYIKNKFTIAISPIVAIIEGEVFNESSKLEALTKALEWVEKDGAE